MRRYAKLHENVEKMRFDMFGETWKKGIELARFKCYTNGPEEKWEVVMKRCRDNGRYYRVVLDPFGNRLMWFDDNKSGCISASRAFEHLVGIAMLDASEW